MTTQGLPCGCVTRSFFFSLAFSVYAKQWSLAATSFWQIESDKTYHPWSCPGLKSTSAATGSLRSTQYYTAMSSLMLYHPHESSSSGSSHHQSLCMITISWGFSCSFISSLSQSLIHAHSSFAIFYIHHVSKMSSSLRTVHVEDI